MTLTQQIAELLSKKPRYTFTLEPGHGETYHSGKPTLYGHSTYPRGSVLAGRPLRKFIDQWDTAAEAHTALAEVKKALPKFKYEDVEGTTHIPIDQMTAGLPEDEE